jgi:predicted P-loop ATPase/GTPase
MKTIVTKCNDCGHISGNKSVCYRCRKNDVTVIADLDRIEKTQLLIKHIHGNIFNMIAEFAKDSICEFNCPAANSCPQLAAESPDAVDYCTEQLQKWFEK